MTTACPAPAVTLRALGAGDGPVLDAVFAGLSPRSRYLRFHGAVPHLTTPMRAALTAVDGRRHVAVGAFAGDEAVGIARLVPYRDGPPGRVELAVEVVDAWQDRGIGTRLVRAVVELGRSVGHTEVVAEVLAANVAVRALLSATFGHLVWSPDGPEITYSGALEAA
jgi:RimJ/RimL family protein N-acetyltransferase